MAKNTGLWTVGGKKPQNYEKDIFLFCGIKILMTLGELLWITEHITFCRWNKAFTWVFCLKIAKQDHVVGQLGVASTGIL